MMYREKKKAGPPKPLDKKLGAGFQLMPFPWKVIPCLPEDR